MANTKISALPTVVTPAITDQFAVNQGGASKKETLQQIAGASGLFSPNGTSRLRVASTTSLELGIGIVPLFVNSLWQQRALPSVITIGTGGLSTNTTYYVYMFDNAGTSTLELSTTTHAKDSTYGVETKSADATRTYVGVIRTDASTQFTTDLTNSWFGEPKVWSLSSAGSSTTSGTFVDVTSSSITVLPHSTVSRFKVNYSFALNITNTASQNNGITVQLLDNGSVVTNSARVANAPSAAGGTGAGANGGYTYLSAPGVATTVIYKLQHKSDNTGSSPTATTSNILAYIEELRQANA